MNIWYLATSSKWSLAIYNSQVYSPHLILRSLSCLKLKQKLDRNPYSIGRNTNCTQRESWPGQEEALKIERRGMEYELFPGGFVQFRITTQSLMVTCYPFAFYLPWKLNNQKICAFYRWCFSSSSPWLGSSWAPSLLPSGLSWTSRPSRLAAWWACQLFASFI